MTNQRRIRPAALAGDTSVAGSDRTWVVVAGLKPLRRGLALVALCAGLLAACATLKPSIPYTGLSSSSLLRANPADPKGRIPLAYSAEGIDWRRYSEFVLDPIAIYQGPDRQFGRSSVAEQKEIMAYMADRFESALRVKYVRTGDIHPSTLRIRVTLTGLETNVPVLSTLTKVLPFGLVANGAKSAAGGQANFTGSVSYAVEIYDATSSTLLRAYVTKQYPSALNVTESVGALDAAKAGVRIGSEALLAQLR